MAKTEILPRCSRVISASSDTTHLHSLDARCARIIHYGSAYNMTCILQVMFTELYVYRHFTWQRHAECRAKGQVRGPISGNGSGASAPVHRRPGLPAAARPGAGR